MVKNKLCSFKAYGIAHVFKDMNTREYVLSKHVSIRVACNNYSFNKDTLNKPSITITFIFAFVIIGMTNPSWILRG